MAIVDRFQELPESLQMEWQLNSELPYSWYQQAKQFIKIPHWNLIKKAGEAHDEYYDWTNS